VESFLCIHPLSELACHFLDVRSAAVDFVADGAELLLGLNPSFTVLLLRGLGSAAADQLRLDVWSAGGLLRPLGPLAACLDVLLMGPPNLSLLAHVRPMGLESRSQACSCGPVALCQLVFPPLPVGQVGMKRRVRIAVCRHMAECFRICW